MLDLEKYARQVRAGDKDGGLEKLARSGTGKALLAHVDGERLEQAAKSGDIKTLSAMLRDILSTPEGRSFAAQVERTVKDRGQ